MDGRDVRDAQDQTGWPVRSMGAGVYTTDTDGNVVVVNDEALRLLGQRREDLVGRNAHALVHYQDAAGRPVPADACALLGVARTGVPARSDEDTFWLPDGSPLYVSWLSAPLVSDGQVTGAVVVFTDATQRHLEDEQRRTREEQQAAAAVRLTLLGRVSDALSTLDVGKALRRLARLSVGRTADCAWSTRSTRATSVALRSPIATAVSSRTRSTPDRWQRSHPPRSARSPRRLRRAGSRSSRVTLTSRATVTRSTWSSARCSTGSAWRMR